MRLAVAFTIQLGLIMALLPETVRDIEAFRVWLVDRGFGVLDPLPQWELLRWLSPDSDVPRIIYANKRGVIGKCNNRDAENDWMAWRYAAAHSVGLADDFKEIHK